MAVAGEIPMGDCENARGVRAQRTTTDAVSNAGEPLLNFHPVRNPSAPILKSAAHATNEWAVVEADRE